MMLLSSPATSSLLLSSSHNSSMAQAEPGLRDHSKPCSHHSHCSTILLPTHFPEKAFQQPESQSISFLKSQHVHRTSSFQNKPSGLRKSLTPQVPVSCSGMKCIKQTISHSVNLKALSVAMVSKECYLFPSCTNLGATVVSCSRVLSKNDSTEVCKNNPGRFVCRGRLGESPLRKEMACPGWKASSVFPTPPEQAQCQFNHCFTHK